MRDSLLLVLADLLRAEVRYRSTFSGVIPGICSRTSVLALAKSLALRKPCA